MLTKPSSCQGCPLYGDGKGYVPDVMSANAKVAIVSLAPGMDDEKGHEITGYAGRDALRTITTPQAMIGSSGWMLKQTLLPLAGLSTKDVSLHHLLKCRWDHTPITPKGDLYVKALEQCTHAHLHLPDTARIVVAQGQEAWQYTQGTSLPLHEWRGFTGGVLYRGRTVYATTLIGDLFRDPHERFLARRDWRKLRELVAGVWPRPVPAQCIASPATHGIFEARLQEALQQPEIMVDTEYIPDQKLMTHVGAAWRVGEEVRGFQLEWVRGRATNVERALFMRYWSRLCRQVKMGFWNAKADLPILQHNLHDIPGTIEDPMQAHAVLWPDMDHDYGFVASLYGKYPKLKHLSKDDILTYHWGDVIDLVWIWEALKEEFKQDPLAEQKYRQQNLKLIPILLNTESYGIKLNQARIEKGIPEYQILTDCASILAQAYCGYPINLGSSSQVVAYLQSEGVKLKSVDQDLVAQARNTFLSFDADEEEQQGFSEGYVLQRIEQGAHPLLELRTMYIQNQQVLSHYLLPLRGQDRCYPQINIHTQAGGRHSTTKPALATVPNDLRDILIPDKGCVWIGWDWNQQEPRIQRAESGSLILGAAFDQGHDIHTLFVCDLYGWVYPQNKRDPHHAPEDAEWRAEHDWQGDTDPRRVFSKTTRYEINYGGTGEQAAKKAVRMGLDPKVTKRASQVLLQSDPELRAWFRKVEKEVCQSHIIRSWGGGRRVFYWVDPSNKLKVEEMKRQARNFPPQGGGADLYNLVIVEITEQVPQARFVYGMHDSQYWSVREAIWKEVYPTIKHIATKSRMINGMEVPFPGSFKVYYDDGRVEKVK